MKRRYLALILCIAILLPMVLQAVPGVLATEKNVTILQEGEEIDSLLLSTDEKQTLTADITGILSGDYQWQILLDSNAGVWVDIYDKTEKTCEVSYPLVKNMLDGSGAAYLRCGVSVGEDSYYSEPVEVVITEAEPATTQEDTTEATAVAPAPLPAPVAVSTTEAPALAALEDDPMAPMAITEEDAPVLAADDSTIPDESTTIYTVTIEYVYTDDRDADGNYLSKFAGQRVALPYIAEVAAGKTLDETVTSPTCVGYLPDISSINLATLYEINGNISLTVEYKPANVSYTVRHYQQNIYDDEYTWVDTTMATGYTEALTSDAAAMTYTGFTALSHYHEEIAADSSTMIDIYYDRNYYLISFDLDGGYGVNAIYARYGTALSVSDPQRAGYSFKGWSLDGTTSVSLPGTMPASNQSYTALWTAGNTSYTIAYWLENADTDDDYDFVGSVPASANSGDSVSGSDSAVANGVFTSDEWQYYSYNEDKTDGTVTVSGDGSSVVNVYYDRNEYTLKFYYARKEGSTYDIADNTNNSSAEGGTAANASWVGNFSDKPTLEAKYTEQEETINGNTYYYFTLTAKYGASLSELWPNAPLSSAGNYNFISWGTHYGSGYYTANKSNKNIKGVYSVMDNGLLIDPAVTADQGINHWMVGYWNTTPTMYTYEIYYTLLAGETEDRPYNSVSYKKVTEYTVGSTDGPAGQTALSFDGVTSVGKDYDSDEPTVIRFYYQRREHTVTLDDGYGDVKKFESIPYGDTLSAYLTGNLEPDYPDDLPVGAYEFGGWYQSKEGIGELDTGITMPNEDLIYYALWKPKVYTVTINDGNGQVLSTEAVKYGSKATKPTDPTMENATFIGWYYKDEYSKEQRFDFDNMTITQNMTIYAKWRSEVMKQVEIFYVVENEDGTQTQIADTETLMLRLSQTRTFEAKTGNSLYAEYRTGCFPTTASHSITIEDSHIESEDPVTFTFVYKQYGAVPYQVEFYVQELDGTVRPAFKVTDGKAEFVDTATYATWTEAEKKAFANSNTAVSSGSTLTEGGQYIEQHWKNDKAVVTELYVPDELAVSAWTLPDEYLPSALKIQKVIVPSNTDPTTNITANTIEFIYTYTEPVVDPDTPDIPVYEARYLVQHFVQNSSDTSQYDLYSYSDEKGLSGETATASPISIPGYTFSVKETDTRKQTGTTLDTDKSMSGTITADDTLELNFYYTVNSYPYQVMYLEEGTNRVLAAAKTTDTVGNQLNGLYGSKVTESAISIDGYDVVGSTTKTIYIQMEAGDTASVNIIVFYYKLKSAELVISKSVELDETQAAQEGISTMPSWVYDQVFVFTVYREKGYPKSVYHYTLTDTDGSTKELTVSADIRTIEVSLKHGQKIQFHDFPMGTYTVTETYVPGFRTSVDGYIAQAHEVTLTTDGEVKKLDFLNSFPFYTGDLVIKKNVTKLDSTDPTATEPYKVSVVLKPDDSSREVDRVITWTNAGEKEESTFTVPALSETYTEKIFTIEVLVPVGGEVKLEGVPVGDFTLTEEVKGNVGYIYDYYTVKYNKAVHENDEVKGISHVIDSCIHGGHPTAITLNNTYKKGDLTINKTVTQEYVNDNWDGDTFEFQITGTTELPNGEYTILVNGQEAKATVKAGTNGQNTVSIDNVSINVDKSMNATTGTTDETESEDGSETAETVVNEWSNSLTLENLPAGYYTVTEVLTEEQKAAYSVVSPEPNLLVNDTETGTAFDFTNTYNRTTGNLKISKLVQIEKAGYDIDPTVEFEFVVLLDDPDDAEDAMLTGKYSYKYLSNNNTLDTSDDTTPEGKTTENNGKLTFKLKHGEYVEIYGLPIGQYTVQEKIVDGYDSSFSDTSEAGDYVLTTATIGTGETTELGCVNAYPVYTANLTITKTGAEADQVFVYHVTGGDLDIYVTLVGNSSVTIADLPYDKNDGTTYTVSQENNWSWRYGDKEQTVTIKSNTGETLTFDSAGSTKWLTGNSNWLHNVFTSGGTTE